MKLLERIASRRRNGVEVALERYTTDDYAAWLAESFGWGSFGFGGSQYPLGLSFTSPVSKSTPIGENFAGFVSHGLRANGVVWALEMVRVQVFSQARFQFRRLRQGRPGELFGTPELAPLENPDGGPNGPLLTGVVLDGDLAGNWYGVRLGDRIVRLRPDWVDTVLEEVPSPAGPLGFRTVGFLYWPDGQRGQSARPSVLRFDEVAHFAPMTDPLAPWRGMSWLTPVVRETLADSAFTRHKASFVDNAATPNLAVSLDASVTRAQFEEFMAAMNAAHQGPGNAGKTLYLGGGADVTVVGANMQQLDFKVVQGAGETRLAAAAGVGAVIAQFSEGMQGSSLNAGNYAASRRRFADVTMRHLWQEASGAFANVVAVPAGSHLWYDDRHISFLQEDERDAADIFAADMSAVRQGIEAGFEPDAVLEAAAARDLLRMTGRHTGLTSVQLQPAAEDEPAADEPPAALEEGVE